MELVRCDADKDSFTFVATTKQLDIYTRDTNVVALQDLRGTTVSIDGVNYGDKTARAIVWWKLSSRNGQSVQVDKAKLRGSGYSGTDTFPLAGDSRQNGVELWLGDASYELYVRPRSTMTPPV